jgi:hypothetical protein
MASYELRDAKAIYSTGETAGQALRRAVLKVEELEKDGFAVVGGWLHESNLESEPFAFTFLAQR